MRRTLLTLVWLIPALPTLAQDQTSDRITHLETGVICAPDSVGESPAPDTISDFTNVIDGNPPFVSTVNRVPAVLGVGFGAKAQVDDPFGLDDVTFTIRHPKMGPQSVTQQSFQTYISGNGPSLTFYQFDFDYELVTGRWVMEARKDGQLLYRTQFDVVPPEQLPELASVCGFENLLSFLSPHHPTPNQI